MNSVNEGQGQLPINTRAGWRMKKGGTNERMQGKKVLPENV